MLQEKKSRREQNDLRFAAMRVPGLRGPALAFVPVPVPKFARVLGRVELDMQCTAFMISMECGQYMP